jgi:hypothetical protein
MEIVSQFAEALHADAETLAGPFGGFAINLNVATKIHSDHDRRFCVVLAITGDCQGGELCLEELGLTAVFIIIRNRISFRAPFDDK